MYVLKYVSIYTLSDLGDLSRTMIQLSPKGEVNSCVEICRNAKRRGIYLVLFNDPEGDSCFKLKTSLSKIFVYNLPTFLGFCQMHFYDFVANSA